MAELQMPGAGVPFTGPYVLVTTGVRAPVCAFLSEDQQGMKEIIVTGAFEVNGVYIPRLSRAKSSPARFQMESSADAQQALADIVGGILDMSKQCKLPASS